MRLEIINPVSTPLWDEALESCPGASFFHTTRWARVLVDSYGYKPAYFCSGGKPPSVLVPLMEVSSFLTGKRGVSLPFSDYSSPLFDRMTDPMEAMDQLIRHGRSAGWKYIEIRDPDRFKEGIPTFTTYIGHVLDLERTEETLYSSFRGSTKRSIRKAQNEGVEVRRSTSLESVRAYYRLHCMTRRTHGLPPQPWRFFQMVYEHVISKGLGFVVLASRGGADIAGAVYFHFGNQAIYQFGASDKAYQNLRANNLVMWEAIRWCRAAGYGSFCFGRTEHDNQGLLQFKDGWGMPRRTIRYYRYDMARAVYVAGPHWNAAVYGKIFRALPVSVLRAVGTALYRHVG